MALCVPSSSRLCSGAGAAAAGRGTGDGGRRGRAAPALLSDMISLTAIANGFAALAGRIRSFFPAFLPPPAWMGTQTGRGPTSRLALRRLCFQPRMETEIPPRRASRSRAAPIAVPRGHGSCPKQVTLISPISDGETETGSSAVTPRGTQGPAPANSPLPKGGRRLPLLGQSWLESRQSESENPPRVLSATQKYEVT